MRYLLLLLCSTFCLHSAESDSTRRRVPKLDLESLSPDSFKVESDIVNMSAGWFPRVGTFRSIELSGSDGLIFHDGMFHQYSNVPGSAFGLSGLLFSDRNTYSIDDRISLLPFSSDESEDEVIEQEYSTQYLRTRFSVPELGMLLRIGLGIRFVNSMLFAEDNSKSYLNLQNTLSPLHELHAISLDETELMNHLSVEIPFYGASLDLLGQQSYSIYSMFGGINLNYVLESNLTHQSIIMQGRDEIRYPSGSNVLTLQKRSFMREIERIRMSVETGLGWEFGFGPLHLGFEGYMLLPLNSILKNHEWNTIFIGIRSSFGISF
ncbi:MAG: hypothetical protein ACKOX1_00250 [Ignavibacteria bacterium]